MAVVKSIQISLEGLTAPSYFTQIRNQSHIYRNI